MVPEHDNYVPVNPLGHVEALASVTDRSLREKQQQKRKKKKRKQIDAQLEEERAQDADGNIDDEHIDFHA